MGGRQSGRREEERNPMKNWRELVVQPETSLLDSVALIDRTAHQMALVVGGDDRLLGVLSDGDIRRAVLRGVPLTVPVSEVMNRNPTTAPADANHAELLTLMRRKVLRHMPLTTPDGRVVGVMLLETLIGALERPNRVVLMAGGLGSRLMPLTERCPKPMLKVGGKPILESIVENFFEQGFRNFYFAVNYMAEMVQGHFGDGRHWGVNIEYLQENKRLGTAGALSLLPEVPAEPLIVMNGDLLTRMRFDNMLAFHQEQGALATMAVREYDFQVPYGVVKLDGHRIAAMEEKPVQRFFVNAGIYALSPEALPHIPADTFFDMPTLFERLLAAGHANGAYPLREYWLDIGRMEEFERAQQEWVNNGAPK
jgi:dTDP-glucose pyrophosphorylase